MEEIKLKAQAEKEKEKKAKKKVGLSCQGAWKLGAALMTAVALLY